MPTTTAAKRIEILCDTPLIPRVVTVLDAAGVKGWSVIALASGSGRDGSWQHDELTGAAAKSLVVAVAGVDAAQRFTVAIAPLLDAYGMLLITGDVSVVRPERF